MNQRYPYDRRRFLKSLGGIAAAGALPRILSAQTKFAANPFALGVASGYPLPGGVVLWTRLAPEPLAPGGGMAPAIVPVAFEVAADAAFRKIVTKGSSYATPDWGYSVHIEVDVLEPDRWYWYRFHAGNATSPIGRTRTAPALDAEPSRLRFAVGSCQQYEQGYYAAYRHMLADDLDLIVHLGDYIYESSWGKDHVRKHEGPEPITLDDYRARFARYKTDPDLQAAHALCPWLVTWDDHEVENDYADAISERNISPEQFLLRRAAAYKAYYEHMPLRREALPQGPHMLLYARTFWGATRDVL